jgi:DNA-binding transcriptional MerR regulator
MEDAASTVAAMKKRGAQRYSPSEFARRVGVTVRTLHHYDRIGLLKPREHTHNGFRLYGDDDVVRLQQIVTLKFIGFPLRDIRRILQTKGSGLREALRAQRRTLEEKRRHLDAAIRAIARAEKEAASGPGLSWRTFQKITEEIQMQNDSEFMKKYYSDEARELIEQRQSLWSPELQKDIEEKWTTLIRDIEAAAAAGVDPAGDKGQELARRHTALIEAFTGGHQAIADGLDKLWADQANWPDSFKKQVYEPFAQRGVPAAQGSSPKLLSEAGDAFLNQALEASKGS